MKDKLPELKPEPPIVIVFVEARVDVPLLSPNNIPVLVPVELTTIFSLKVVPLAACAN